VVVATRSSLQPSAAHFLANAAALFFPEQISNPTRTVAFEVVTRAGQSVDVSMAQASAEGGSALPSSAKHVNFSLADVNSLISKTRGP
jgi:hypothetical protein